MLFTAQPCLGVASHTRGTWWCSRPCPPWWSSCSSGTAGRSSSWKDGFVASIWIAENKSPLIWVTRKKFGTWESMEHLSSECDTNKNTYHFKMRSDSGKEATKSQNCWGTGQVQEFLYFLLLQTMEKMAAACFKLWCFVFFHIFYAAVESNPFYYIKHFQPLSCFP